MAGAITHPIGMPDPSVIRERLVPSFPVVCDRQPLGQQLRATRRRIGIPITVLAATLGIP